MARTASSSDGESISAPVKSKANKENQAFSLTTTGEHDAKPTKQQSTTAPSKRSSSKQSTTMAKPTAAVAKSKRSKSKVARDSDAESRDDEDEQMDLVAETQEEQEQVKKTAAKKGASKGASKKAEAAEDAEQETPRERRLKAKLELSEANRVKMQELYQRLQDTRTTKAEESEQQLTLIAAERQEASYNTLTLYKNENDALRAEIAELRASGLSTTSPRASSRPSLTDKSRVQELEERLVAVEQEREGEREKENERLKERDGKWERELARTVKAKDEEQGKMMAGLKLSLAQSTKDLAIAKQELLAEIEHSKSLQQKLKSGGTSGISSSSATSTEKLTEELETVQKHLALNEDLTGFTVVSTKSEPEGEVYNCILSDYLAENGSLTFKLTFHPDETVSYLPSLVPSRDVQLAAVLPSKLHRYLRFKAENSNIWFKELWEAINSRPKQ